MKKSYRQHKQRIYNNDMEVNVVEVINNQLKFRIAITFQRKWIQYYLDIIHVQAGENESDLKNKNRSPRTFKLFVAGGHFSFPLLHFLPQTMTNAGTIWTTSAPSSATTTSGATTVPVNTVTTWTRTNTLAPVRAARGDLLNETEKGKQNRVKQRKCREQREGWLGGRQVGGREWG